ncbi:RnfABCDGE type electron transport complex subunit D [Pseudooceanicola sp. LIPI14-2-Ac024]|uniref:RnfABCDGE type electron transport complex subunit D n=1 Tax=Pseudooceanicola sp. LIPI14-2-Ac024 TaxID=3344875 RepID=UPI0035D12581
MTRGIWDRETVALLLLIAVFPLVLTWLIATGIEGAARLAFFLVVAGIWHVIWMLARAQPPSLAGALTAVALAMLAPEDLGLIALLLSTSFGVVMADLAFGGWGRNVLNPGTVTLAFMGFGYATAPWPVLEVQLAWAAVPVGLIGVLAGVISPALLLGAVAVLAVAMLSGLDLGGAMPAILVVLVLLVADPVASAASTLGRWLTGGLYGGLVVLFAANWQGVDPLQMCVSAALLTSLAAPLFDEVSLMIWLQRRKRTHG